MREQYLVLLLSLPLIFAVTVMLALLRRVAIKAFLKIPFAVFSFETKEPDDGDGARRERLRRQ